MSRKKVKLRNILASMMLVFTAGTANTVFAFGSIGGTVDGLCAAAGNPLLNEFQPQLLNNCTACHDDGNGGSGGGFNAVRQGNEIAFFCPPVEPPPVEPPVPPVEPPVPPVEPPLVCTDNDGDGFATEGGNCGPMDCNDNEFAINPSAAEICTDGIDNNCNNLIDTMDPNAIGCPAPAECTDLDGDGFSIEGGNCGPMDCNDSNASQNPGANEICDDSIDNNCDGAVDAADVACQLMEDDEHRQDRHDKDRDDDDDDRDDDDDDEAEDEAEDREDRRDNRRRNRRGRDND